jgi:hypothetical protein
MYKNDGKDYIYVIWKEPETRRQYTIGELCKNDNYQFSYGYEIKKAIDKGFNGLICFENFDETYCNNVLFPAFSSRLPNENRRGIERILNKYGLNQYDAYELLKRSGGKTPTDNLEFIDPLPNKFNGEQIERYFYIAGTRHYIGCEGKECTKSVNIEKEDSLKLVLESDNEYDCYAIKIYDGFSNHIGYIPRYYSELLTDFIKQGYECYCEVSIINKENNCNECIKAKLIIKNK